MYYLKYAAASPPALINGLRLGLHERLCQDDDRTRVLSLPADLFLRLTIVGCTDE